MVAHVLCKWFRRQHGGLGKENKFITLPYLHITPQRAVNGDSETHWPHPLLQKLLGEARGWMCHLQLLPQTPLTSPSLGSLPHFKHLVFLYPAHRVQLWCFSSVIVSRFVCRLQEGCDVKMINTAFNFVQTTCTSSVIPWKKKIPELKIRHTDLKKYFYFRKSYWYSLPIIHYFSICK